MAVNSIQGEVVAGTLKPVIKPDVSLNQVAKAAHSANDQLSNSTRKPSVVDSNTKTTAAPMKNKTPDEGAEHGMKPVRTMSHVVVEYNMKGNIRIKFIDSHDNVTYQIPSEMVAKIEDQMLQIETSAAVKV